MRRALTTLIVLLLAARATPIALRCHNPLGIGLRLVRVTASIDKDRFDDALDYCLYYLPEGPGKKEGSCRAVEARIWTRDFDRIEPGRGQVSFTVRFAVRSEDGTKTGYKTYVVSTPVCTAGGDVSCSEGGDQ
jgi:hypothetical protein